MKCRITVLLAMMAFGASFLYASDNSLRTLRINMNNGDTKEYLVESIQTITFEANPNDSSYMIDDVPEEKESAEMDRIPEAEIPDNYSEDVPNTNEMDRIAEDDISDKASESSASNSETTSFQYRNEVPHFSVSWNHHRQFLQVEAETNATAKLDVFDLQGAKISGAFMHLSTGSNRIPLGYLRLSTGKYMVRVEMNGKMAKQEITISK